MKTVLNVLKSCLKVLLNSAKVLLNSRVNCLLDGTKPAKLLVRCSVFQSEVFP